ncbi:uncharacterized protein LOC143919267 [Arctopsyche grandis]|uniref:uncharacterized protein LOC143919267 n=1 Tax=Arctopsyche grandis TaxID=121162 RepID=UPI00406D64C5
MFMNDWEEITVQHLNVTANLSQMDSEGFRDLREWCNPSDISPLQTPIIDDEFGFFNFVDMANSPKTIDSEGISKNMSTITGCSQYKPNPDVITDAVKNTTIVDESLPEVYNNYLYSGVSSVQSTLPEYEDEVEIDNQSYVNSPENGVFYENGLSSNNYENAYTDDIELSSTTNSFVTNDSVSAFDSDSKNNNMINSTTICVDPRTKITNIFFDNEESYDRSQTTMNYDRIITESVQTSFLLTDIKNNNDKVINDIIINGNYDLNTDEIKSNGDTKESNLKIICKNPNNDSGIWDVNNDVTTPDLFKTIELLETDTDFSSSHVSDCVTKPTNRPISRNIAMTSKNVDYDYSCTLTPPDTPKTISSKRKRDSEDEDISYVPPSKKKSNKIESTCCKTARMGRTSKKMDDNCSLSSFTTDDNSIASPDDMETLKRQRNNEASRRSRYNRKLKDMNMANFANDLEERNNKLRIDLVKLESKTVRLRKLLFDHMVQT